MFGAVLGMGIPNFFLAVILIQIFAIDLHWFPVAGTSGLKSVVLPAVVLAVEAIAINLRMVGPRSWSSSGSTSCGRSTPRASRQFRIVSVHAFRNALPAHPGPRRHHAPEHARLHDDRRGCLPLAGARLPPGGGILNRDYTFAQVLALLMTFLVILFNFLADVGQH